MPDPKRHRAVSVLAVSAYERLLIACVLIALVWAVVAWALW
jgi:hypothetical protein